MKEGDSGRIWAEKLTLRGIEAWSLATLRAFARMKPDQQEHHAKTIELLKRVHDTAHNGERADTASITEMVFQYARHVALVRLSDFGQTGNRQTPKDA